MLELNGGDAVPGGDAIKDVTEATFMADVVEASREVPVIVDFWAPWCGPCKTLGPVIEAAVAGKKGKVKLAKIDVDQNQAIAQQMQVQSIPAVFAFVDGQPIDGFMGNQTPAEINAFVDRVAAAGGPDAGLEEAVAAANEMLDQGAFADAAQTFNAILDEDPENIDALAGMMRSYLKLNELDNAKAFLETVPENLRSNPTLASVIAEMELSEAAGDAGDIGELRGAVDAKPDDHQARFDLATALAGQGDNEAAIDHLLELFRRDRDWNDGAAKEQLLKLFDLLGPQDELAQTSRRRLTSMIFA